jgi:hypothetical protein
MSQGAQVPAGRAVVAVLLAGLLGAAASVLVVTHPFTDEGDRDGLRLLGDHSGGPPGQRSFSGVPGEHVPPGWDRGDKDGWHGQSVPPGWSQGDKDGWHGQSVPPGWWKHGEDGERHDDGIPRGRLAPHPKRDHGHGHDR